MPAVNHTRTTKTPAMATAPKHTERRHRKHILAPLAIIAVIALLTFFFLAIRQYEYDRGIEAGKAEQQENTRYALNEIATLITEKQKLNETLSSLPTAELDATTIDQYLEALAKVTPVDQEAQNLLKSYQEKWQAFKEVYATEDNTKIAEEFNSLKAAATETAKKLTDHYNSVINKSLENL